MAKRLSHQPLGGFYPCSILLELQNQEKPMNTRNILLWVTAIVPIVLISACSPPTTVIPTPIPSTATPTEPPIIDMLDIGSLENQCSAWASSGSWIRVKGRLGIGFMTVCSQGWCLIHISQPELQCVCIIQNLCWQFT